jgi:ATP-dependent DNA helicase RecG
VADLLKDRDLLETAREEAIELIEKDPNLQGHEALREVLFRRFEKTLDLAVTG